MLLRCGSYTLDLSIPRVMGILNVTPDSFSDGGRFVDVQQAIEHGIAMAQAGAAMIDVGGESTRPGAPAVGESEELDRVLPVIGALARELTIPISVDTSKCGVMTAAVSAGAAMINDVRALQEPGALAAATACSAAVCLMHMHGVPRTMQQDPQYQDVVVEVHGFLQSRVVACTQAGIAKSRLLIDPGIGFGKRLTHNLALLAALPVFAGLGLPVLIGVSRKSMFGQLLGRAVDQRLAGSTAVATAAVLAGASVVRTHDVAATVDAIEVAVALKAAGYRSGN